MKESLEILLMFLKLCCFVMGVLIVAQTSVYFRQPVSSEEPVILSETIQ